MIAGARRKAEGLTSGVPDWESPIAVPPFTGFHCEMKRRKGVPSDVTENQREWLDTLAGCGRKAVVAFGADDAIRQFCDYLGIDP